MFKMSQEVAQNIATSSAFNVSNIFDDVALVRAQLDCLGLSYDPDEIANMLIEQDGSADRVAIVVNKIIDCLPNLGPEFENNSTHEGAESSLNQVQAPDKSEEKQKSEENVPASAVKDTASQDYEPSPSKLFKPVNPKKNPFSYDLPSGGSSVRLKNSADLCGTSSSSSTSEEYLSAQRLLPNESADVSKFTYLGKTTERTLTLDSTSGPSDLSVTNQEDEKPGYQGAEITSQIFESVSNSLKTPLSISVSSVSRANHRDSTPEQLSIILECMNRVEITDNDLNIIDNLIGFLMRGESNSTAVNCKPSCGADVNKRALSDNTKTITLPDSDSASNIGTTVTEPTACPSQNLPEPLCQYFANLMEIFPDADSTYLQDLCKGSNNGEIIPFENDIMQQLIDIVLDNPDYPRKAPTNSGESEVNPSFDEKYRNIIAILPDIDPEFAKSKCEQLSNESYNNFVNELLITEAYPTIKDARMKETSSKIKAYLDNPTIPDFLKLFPNPEEYFLNQKMSSHPEHSLAFLKYRYNLLKSDDIIRTYRFEGFNLTRTCRKLDRHTGPVCKRRRTLPDCKWPAKNDVNFLQEIFYIIHWQEIKQYIEDKNREQKLALEQQNFAGSLRKDAPRTVPEKSDLVLAAFGLFLRSPFEWSRVLQRSKDHAELILKLFTAAMEVGKGDDTQSSPLANNLPTLPFEELKDLLASAPLTTDQGVYIRQTALDRGVVHSILACLAALTHNSEYIRLPDVDLQPSTSSKRPKNKVLPKARTDQHVSYWAKGTGYGSGSTAQSWNVKQALTRQKCEESHITVLIQILSHFIDPKTAAPMSGQNADVEEVANFPVNLSAGKIAPKLSPLFHELLEKSCLIQVLSSYLRNDSVLDMTRHIPIYRAILCLLRVIASNDQYVDFLFPQTPDQESSISSLLSKMRDCVDIYSVNVGSKIPTTTEDGKHIDRDEEASLIQDIQHTAMLIAIPSESMNQNGKSSSSIERPLKKTVEERYLEFMKALQFDEYDMIVENCDTSGLRFSVSHRYEQNIRVLGDANHPSRIKRLAQEVVTLRNSLPLNYSSSVFVRCDSSRLDVMKVLITGPAETPYMNGCFEFDVFFPRDYPSSPLNINLETTGRQTVRFNPNLYNDGKVCLSVLNTWNGRPEEKWNPQTSNILQVLVSIQSLILVPDPYFNEPGYENSRGTSNGTRRSNSYNANIRKATLKWAMVEQLKKPSPCFKTVIQSHFYLKRDEISLQVEKWITEIESDKYIKTSTDTVRSLRQLLTQLQTEISKLTPPPGLEESSEVLSESVETPESTIQPHPSTSAIAGPSSQVEPMEWSHSFMSDFVTDEELDSVISRLSH
nr:PREDICTED: baculoviral IAP repeat-containing protein 6-like isoform X1 [Bemisia tabaci]XP_018902067.1 PREDICTED: baculoviral IAP repeat-containing protein 6-like isoform X1 [Bemisia tabaci]